MSVKITGEFPANELLSLIVVVVFFLPITDLVVEIGGLMLDIPTLLVSGRLP